MTSHRAAPRGTGWWRRRGGRRLLGICAVTALAVAACGGDDDDDAGGGGGVDSAGSAAEVTAPAASTPAQGSATTGSEPTGASAPDQQPEDFDRDGVIRQAYDLAAPSKGAFVWDPVAQPTQLTDGGVLGLVYGHLLRQTRSGELVPDLAEDTEVVNPSTIEITLRDTNFSDGTPFDANAVKAGLERSLNNGTPAAFADSFFDLESVEIIDPQTVRLTIPNGTAASWHDSYLPEWQVSIVKPDDPNLDEAPIGAGPMKVTEYVPESRIVLERNPEYWDADSITVAGVEFVHVPTGSSPTTGPSALHADQVDVTPIATQQLPGLRSNEDYVFEVDPAAAATLMTCKRDGPLAEPLVRRALNLAIDREAISEAVFGGVYEPAHGLWPDGHRFHNPAVEDAIAYDPDAARDLLEEAGYADGFEFDLYVIQGGGMPETAAVLQQMFGEIGVSVNLVNATNFVEDFLIARSSGVGIVPTMGANRQKLLQWTGESIGNTCQYNDPELNDLAEQLTKVSDSTDEAVEIWHEIEQKVVADDTLSIFLLFGGTPAAYNTERVGGMAMTDYLPVVDVRSVYIRADS